MSHSPGPWKIEPRQGRTVLILDAKGDRIVAKLAGGLKELQHRTSNRTRAPYTTEEKRGDVLLVAAAPDLLAALQAVIRDEGKELSRSVLNMASAAVAKATGEPTC